MNILVHVLTFLVCLSLSAEESIDLPDGYVQEYFTEEDFRDSVPLPMIMATGDEKEEADSSVANLLEEGPSSTVANCVSVISGKFFDSETDLVIPGAHPLSVKRSYSSDEKKWRFQHMPILKVGKSKHHLNASYSDGSGSGAAYRINKHDQKKTSTIPLSGDFIKKGLTNWGSGLISGQTNWKNSSLIFVRKGNKKQYLLRKGDRTDRYFERYKRYGEKHQHGAPEGKFNLLKEVSPNGNQLVYFYDKHDKLTEIKALNGQKDILSKLSCRKDNKNLIWASNHSSVKYVMPKSRLIGEVISSHCLPITYNYDDHDRIIRKKFPENRFINIDYSDSKVCRLRGPLGSDSTPVTAYRFAYASTQDKSKLTIVYEK